MAEAKAKGELGKRGGFQPEKLFEPLAIFELTFVGEDKIFAERNLKIIGPTPLPPQK